MNDYRCVTNLAEIRKYLGKAAITAFDFETAPDEEYRHEERAALDPHKAHIVGVSFSNGEDSSIYVPLAHRNAENAVHDDVIKLLAEFAANTEVVKVAHNLAFESMFLYKHGIVLQSPCYDTIAAAQMSIKGNTFRSLADSGLKTLSREWFETELPTFGKVTEGKYFDELDPMNDETVRYACSDSDYTLRIYHLLNDWFNHWLPKHRFIVEEVESPTAVYAGIMKFNGLQVDIGHMETAAIECEERLSKLKDDIAFIIGNDVNIGANASTSAFKNYLYKDLGLPVLKTTAKYQEAADDETMILLAEWCAGNCPELVPLFKLIQEYRRHGKIKSTYVEGYKRYINSATERIHADLMPLATETGRFAARKPNLQNMPRAGADSVGVRNFFTAPEGKVLLSLDFSQIELRVGAFYCRDEKMLETYRVGGDIHDQTATVIYGEGKHDKEQRTIAKNVNFGTFYGLYPSGLQKTLKFKAALNTTLAECEKIIANLKAGYPMLTEWQEDTKATATKNRYTETWLGRRRYLPNIKSSDWSKKSFAERCALNTPIQGTAADILKLALGRIIKGLTDRPWLLPLLQIHDELVFELPEDKVSEAVSFIKECMETRPFEAFDVPITADASVGRRFGEMEDWEP